MTVGRRETVFAIPSLTARHLPVRHEGHPCGQRA